MRQGGIHRHSVEYGTTPQRRLEEADLLHALRQGGGYKGALRVFLKCFLLGFCSRRLVAAFSGRHQSSCYKNRSAITTGLFLGTMFGSFKALVCFGLKLFPHKCYVRPILFISAVISSQALRIDRVGKAAVSRHSLMASFMFVRSAWRLTSSFFERSKLWNFSHADSSVFIICCTQIMWCWFYYPNLIAGVYRKWITRMAHMDEELVIALRKLYHGEVRYGTPSDILRQYCLRNGLDPKRADLRRLVPQSYVHPATGNSTLLWLLLRFAVGVTDASLVYLPVHIIRAAVLKRQAFIKAPMKTGWILVQNIFQSSSFLGAFIALAWAPILFLRKFLKQDTKIGVLLGSLACGFAIFIERKGRRKEFAMFVAPRVLQIWFDYLCKHGIIQSRKGGSIWLFAFSVAAWVQAEGVAIDGDAKQRITASVEERRQNVYKGSKSLAYLLMS